MAPKKRKLSDLSAQKNSVVVKDILLSCRDKCNELGMDESDEAVRELDHIIDKFTNAKRTSFSDVSLLTLGKMGITVRPMDWLSGGQQDAKTYGNATLPVAQTVGETRMKINDVLKYVSLESEAGCRILINTLLIHVASNLETDTSGVAIVPELRIENMPLEDSENSFGGVVDYMVFYGKKTVRDRIIQSKTIAFSDTKVHKWLKCNICEAKPEDLFLPSTCLPQAAMAAVMKARALQLKVFRGCVTSGRHWVFFIYNAENPAGQGKTVHWSEAIPLGEYDSSTVHLELVLGVLRDWVENGHDSNLRFFKYDTDYA